MRTEELSQDDVAFGLPAGLALFLAEGRKAAADIREASEANVAATLAAVERVQALGLGELIAALDAPLDAPTVLFHVAEALANANLNAAWPGLYDVPAFTLADHMSVTAVAIPRSADAGASGRYAVWIPGGPTKAEPSLAFYHPASHELFGPCRLLDERLLGGDAAVRGLLGFPDAEFHPFRLAAPLPALGIRAVAVPREAWAAYERAQVGLLLGLVVGASRRLVEEAYSYARLRQSAGRPIIQHQAVALRLADLAIHQEALSLYATAVVEGCNPPGLRVGVPGGSATHVSDLAFKIARDAVQIAAGHGYVEGLPFRRLFEQVRTCTVMLGAFTTGTSPALATSRAA